MEFPATSPIAPIPTEASQGPGDIVIAEANAIRLAEALAIARETGVALGKSTLQRWAKAWAETAGSPVKALLQVTRNGRHYEIDRDDFEAWLLEQVQNQKTPRDPARPVETSQDPVRSHETQQDPERSQEASSEAAKDADQLKEFQKEIMDLKIDLGVRKQLLNKAKDEMDGLREKTEKLMWRNGYLQRQLEELPSPERNYLEGGEVGPPVDNPEQIDGSAV